MYLIYILRELYIQTQKDRELIFFSMEKATGRPYCYLQPAKQRV